MTNKINTTTVKRVDSSTFGEVDGQPVTLTSPPLPVKESTTAQTVIVKTERK